MSVKNFVLRMEMFPQSKYLLLHTLRLSGVEKRFVPIEEMIPITKYDYWCANNLLWFK